jgi:secreted PhoX family phosphatase
VFSTRWIDIDDPDPVDTERNGVYTQGREQGGAQFRRLEGAWYGNGRIYFVSTSGGPIHKGQVWEYTPSLEQLRLVFASTSVDVLDSPDNICVSPRGGLLLCEDGSGTEYVHGLTTAGTIFPFAQNNVVLNGERNGLSGDYRGSEFAGACFSVDGEWFFVKRAVAWDHVAITGPWSAGAL